MKINIDLKNTYMIQIKERNISIFCEGGGESEEGKGGLLYPVPFGGSRVEGVKRGSYTAAYHKYHLFLSSPLSIAHFKVAEQPMAYP